MKAGLKITTVLNSGALLLFLAAITAFFFRASADGDSGRGLASSPCCPAVGQELSDK